MNGQKHDPVGLSSDPAVRSLIDVEGLHRRLGNDVQAVDEVLRAFAQDVPKLIAQLVDAVSAGEGDRIRRLAHSLKGSLLWIGADGAASAAQTLEHDASDHPPEPRDETLAKLRASIDPLLEALRGRSTGGPP